MQLCYSLQSTLLVYVWCSYVIIYSQHCHVWWSYVMIDSIQLKHSFEVNIRIYQPKNSDVHLGKAERKITFKGWPILMLTEKECTNCFLYDTVSLFLVFFKIFHIYKNVCGGVPVQAGWVYVFLWFYVQEHPRAQPAVVLFFQASHKTGPQLKVSFDRLGEAGNRTCDPWFTRHRFMPYSSSQMFLVHVH